MTSNVKCMFPVRWMLSIILCRNLVIAIIFLKILQTFFFLQLSTKGKIIQSVAMYEVLSKRKVALDQLRNGLKTLDVLKWMSNHPSTFESLFTFNSVELTPTTVNNCLRFEGDLDEKESKVKEMVTQFINTSSDERLKLFLQFCTGGKSIPTVSYFRIMITFRDTMFISSSTCIFSLQLPNCFRSYGIFETAMLSAISSSGKSFTNV